MVTGSGYDAGTNTFSTIALTDITVEGDALELSNVDLNIQTEADFINNTTINADSLTVIAGDDFTNNSGATINAGTVTIEVAHFGNDINNNGTVSSDSLNLIFNDDFTHYSYSFTNFNNFSNLAITTGGNFNNNSNLTANNFTVTAGNYFINNSTINVDNLNVTARNNFLNRNNSTINAISITTTTEEAFYNRDMINTTNLTVTAKNFNNNSQSTLADATIDADTITIEVANFADDIDNAGIISAASLNFILTADFTHASDSFTGFINFSNLAITTEGTFTNTINLAGVNLTITANSFNNTGGVVNADTLALSVAGDFDYLANYLGTITTNAFNLQVGGDFSYDDSASNFTWDAQNSLVVSGNADITTNNYTQAGAINVAGVLTITANNYTYDNTSSGFVWEETDTLTVLGDANITALNFINHGSINVADSGSSGSLEITAGYTAINQGSIVSANLDLTANDFFRNLTGGDIDVASLNITAGGKVTNTANINVEGTLNITANNDSSRDNDPTGFYVSNRGNITATTLNIAAADNFYNRGNITATNFTTSAKSVFFLNKEIDSFVGTYDGGNISLNGNSSFRAAGGIIENYGNIDLGNNILDISADSFINHASANVTADTLNLTVNSFIQNGSIDATIDQ